MRYSVYKQLAGVTASITEATLYVKEHLKSINILLDCVEGITTVKNILKLNKIEVCNEISEFLEMIDSIAECLEANADYSYQIEKLCQFAQKINEYCKTEIKYKFRIVFFAELGSKWDAMDSVYWAYKNREDCDVAVVLAPIYRAIKLSNGEVRSDVIYRDYLTDMGIQHILFKDYDIKKDMPDIVFTSQLYESVTPEQFWAENIAPYTRLVYLPYFTPNEAVTDEQRLVQTNLPIHELAWKVVCHSSKVKEYYSKYFKNKGLTLVDSGLPKWDYVVNMQNRQIELPKEWEKLKGKKVILRNFHYTGVEYLEKCIKHIRLVISQGIYKNMAFIYRFHPMVETMIKVYFPEYENEWIRLKEEVKKSSNVVIDMNETYDCAFKFSDVFITDFTSLISQYVLTKKPVIVLFWGKYNEILEQEKLEGYFIKYSNLYWTTTFDNAIEMVDAVLKNDTQYESRLKFIEENFKDADGKIGERLSEYFIKEILKEDNTKEYDTND